MARLNEKLQALREARGWSKTYVAQHIGLANMQTYANWEYGSREPDLETVKKLAKLFEVSTDYLLGNETKQPERHKKVDLDDKDVLFTYRGKPLSDDDRAIIERLMNGKADN